MTRRLALLLSALLALAAPTAAQDSASAALRWRPVQNATHYTVRWAGPFGTLPVLQTTDTVATLRLPVLDTAYVLTAVLGAYNASDTAALTLDAIVPARQLPLGEIEAVLVVDTSHVAPPDTATPPPPPDPIFLNEPAGHTVTVDVRAPFSIPLPTQPAGRWLTNAPDNSYPADKISVVDGNLRITFPEGWIGGSSPIRVAITDTTTLWAGAYYIGVQLRYSRPWTRHHQIDKVLYFGELSSTENPNAGQVYIARHGQAIGSTVQSSQAGAPEVCPVPGDSQRLFPCEFDENGNAVTRWNHNLVFDDGEWHTLEIVARSNTNGQANGYIAAYTDGRLEWEYFNVRWSSTNPTARFYGVNIDPIPGGGGGEKPQTEWLEIGALRVSGRN